MQEVSHTAVGRELLKCRKSVHPGVKSMWTFQQLGDPSRTALDGDGCGAAMRVAPIGVLYSPDRLDELVRGAYESSIPTHGGQLAISAAAAVAGAISRGLGGEASGRSVATGYAGSPKSRSIHSGIEGQGDIHYCHFDPENARGSFYVWHSASERPCREVLPKQARKPRSL